MRAFGSSAIAALSIFVAITACKPTAIEHDVSSPANPGPDSPTSTPAEQAASSSPAGSRGFRDVIPSQRWPDVPARVVGLLYQRGPQPWGESLHHAGAFVSAHELARTEYAFSTQGSSPYALYFISPDGVGRNHIRRWQVQTPDGVAHFDAAMFDASTPNGWGLHEPAHIVEIEVNQGRGGRGLHFVATNVHVLDENMADPTQLLVQVRKRFDAVIDDHRAALQAVHVESSKRANARANERAQRIQAQHEKATIEHDDDGERVALAPTWRVDSHELAVIIVYRRAGSVTVHTHRPPSTGGIDHGPRHSKTELGFGVRLGARYVVDAKGEVTLEELLKIEDASWDTEL